MPPEAMEEEKKNSYRFFTVAQCLSPGVFTSEIERDKHALKHGGEKRSFNTRAEALSYLSLKGCSAGWAAKDEVVEKDEGPAIFISRADE